MSVSPHLVSGNATGLRHLLALDYSGENHLMCFQTATYTNKVVIIEPSEIRHACYAYKAIPSSWYVDCPQLITNCRNGFNAKTANDWQSGEKAVCTYYGHGTTPSSGPDINTNSSIEACCSATAYKFRLYDLPTIYTISSARLLLYRPSFLYWRPGVFGGGQSGVPEAEYITPYYDNFWTFYAAFSGSLQAPSFFQSGAQVSANAWDLMESCRVLAGEPAADRYTSRVYDFWNNTGYTSSTSNSGYGILTTLSDHVDDFGGIWVPVTLSSTPISTISTYRDELWLHAGFYLNNAFSWGGTSAPHGGTVLGGIFTLFVGGIYLELTLNG